VDKVQNVNEFIISKQGNKISIVIDGNKVDLNDILSMDIHIEYGCIHVNSKKRETFKLGDA
jgi:hypothetical protein